MRTNIVIDDELMARAQALAGTATKRETVDLALRELVRRHGQRKMLDLAGKIEWIGDLDEMRRDRTFE
jgi:Arc/MetJ family transcription regulator